MHAPPESVAAVVAGLRAAGCVFAEDEAALLISGANTPVELDKMVQERVVGRPLEYILGFTEFCGLQVEVDDGVFVPRQRTGFLVHCAVELLTGTVAPVVLDLCCGCGAIGTAIAHRLPIELHASDVDPRAIRSARRNIEPLGGHVYEGDLFQPLPLGLCGRVDILVVNAPYVPTDAIAMMPPEARLYEPREAHDGGHDGLDIQRLVIAAAAPWMKPDGHLLIETGKDQAAQTAQIMRDNGFAAQISSSDELQATVVIGSCTLSPTGPAQPDAGPRSRQRP